MADKEIILFYKTEHYSKVRDMIVFGLRVTDVLAVKVVTRNDITKEDINHELLPHLTLTALSIERQVNPATLVFMLCFGRIHQVCELGA